MPGMPFHLEKGPFFATLEALYREPARLPVFLHTLWLNGGDALGSFGAITSPEAADPNSAQTPAEQGARRKQSMLRDWFGDEPDGTRQQPWGVDPNTGQLTLTTGYWALYHGEVRDIVAETLMRAAEVSLGIDRPEITPSPPVPAVPQPGDRHWPVEFFWKCGQPRFEGWVTWRQDSAGVGQVTVIFATPATPDQVLLTPAEGSEPNLGAQWPSQPQGMWVCSQESHEQRLLVTSWATAKGEWIVPLSAVMFTVGKGKVGTWAPKYGLGGAPTRVIPFVQGA